ncbi:MAG: hypothetical protein ACHQ6T_08325 [Myxococcota bacterium]
MARLVLVLLVAAAVGYCYFSGRAISRPPGVLAPDEPRQENLTDGPHFAVGDYDLHALARFEIDARVLSAEHYSSDREAQLAPVDLALGWGPMSSNEVLEPLRVSQSGRFYEYSWSSGAALRASPGEIARHSANMHMIPLDPETRDTLLHARRGNLIHLKGWLVEAHAKDGWRWRSSLTRTDTGRGACELVAVEHVELD